MPLEIWMPLDNSINLGNYLPGEFTGCVGSSVTLAEGGKVRRKSYQFTNNTNSYIKVSGSNNSDFLNKFINKKSFSMAIWFKGAGCSSGQSIVGIMGSTYGVRCLLAPDKTIVFDLYNSDTGLVRLTSNPTNVTDGRWHHIAVIAENTGTDTIMKIYYDGQFQVSGSFGSVYYSSWTNTMFHLATDTNDSTYHLTGSLSDFRFYSHALSGGEILELYKGKVLDYTFNDKYLEKTTNLTNKISYASFYNGATSKYGGEANIQCTDVMFDGYPCTKVSLKTASETIPFVWYSDGNPATSGSYKSISLDIYPAVSAGHVTTINPYSYAGGLVEMKQSDGSWSTGSTHKYIPIYNRQWNHVEFRVYNNNGNTGFGYINLNTSTSSLSDVWYIRNLQVEEKDHPTPYAPTSRTDNIMYDSSEYENNGTISGNLEIIDDSEFKYVGKFDGGVYINTPLFLPQTTTQEHTVSAWVYPTSNSTDSIKLVDFNLGYHTKYYRI